VAASTLLASRESLKCYLGVAASDEGQDALFDQLLAYASERIESHCGRKFKSEEITEDRDGTGTREMVLSRRPVTELAEVCEDADREFGEKTKLPELDLVLYPDAGVVARQGAVFPRGDRNVRVVYTAGYGTIPDDLAAACVKLAAAWYAHARTGGDGVGRESLGDYSVEYAAASLPSDVEAALAPYREPAVG